MGRIWRMSQGTTTAKGASKRAHAPADRSASLPKAHDQEPLRKTDHAEPSGVFSLRAYRRPLPLSAEIAEWLGEEIISGRLAPGTRLVARELSERLGVSMTPIREAFRLVSGEGLVRLSSRRGAWVAEINTDEVEDIYECRAALQGLAARQCAARASDRELARLKEIVDAMSEAFRSGDRDRTFELNVKFHNRLLAASGNVTAHELTERLGRRTLQLRRLSLSLPGRQEQSIRVHQRIVSALCARKGVEADTMMREQIMDAAAALIRHARDLKRDEK